MSSGAQSWPAHKARTAHEASASPAQATAHAAESAVILNADDWGRDAITTDRILDCARAGVVSSASAMVFMQDSARAADIARAHDVDTGLHLNLTLEFSAPECPPGLLEQQTRLKRFLLRHRLATVVYHPGLAACFASVVRAQMEEYERLYGAAPRRIDGHHHMHLCANVIAANLLPAGVMVRRNFSFRAGEKSFLNRAYRSWRDRQLARRYQITDYFFDLMPVEPERLQAIFALGRCADVEIETHPANDAEYRFLRGPDFAGYASQVSVLKGYILRKSSLPATHSAACQDCAGAVRNPGGPV